MDSENLLPIKILHDFTQRVERLGIAYMLTDSVAMMRYSAYRFTADVDVILKLKSSDASKFIQILESDYYVPHTAISRAIDTQRMFNVIHSETAFKIAA